jgi:hypothetical protein
MNQRRIKAIGLIAIIIAATFSMWNTSGQAQNCRQGVRGGAEGGIGNHHGCP